VSDFDFELIEERNDVPPAKRRSEARGARRPRRSSSRPLVESLLVLILGMTIVRAFTAEAYIVPTGSMAPTLLGVHEDITCDSCGFQLSLGIDEHGHAGHPICPNCGADLEDAVAAARNGDRLLVHKNFYEWRPPRRWEVAVFLNPQDPGQAYVKRIVGLPGESIQLFGGDIYIDGRIAPKSPKVLRGMRILVHDHRFRPPESDWFPRWSPLREAGGPSLWREDGSTFRFEPAADHAQRSKGNRFDEVEVHDAPVDWLEYRHIDPDRAHYGPIRDFVAYNGAQIGSGRRVDDLMLETELRLGPKVRAIALRFRSGADQLEVRIPTDGRAPLAVDHGGRRKIVLDETIAPRIAAWAASGEARLFEAAFVDRHLSLVLDGEVLLNLLPIEPLEPTATPPGPRRSPLAIGLVGGGPAEIRTLKVYRDVYYTEGLAHAPTKPFGVGEPYQLDPEEYFVLGDNSAVSNDSRFWKGSPVVRAEMLIGKPFLVHLPSRGVPLRVFGGETYWVPDLREIRYIR